MESSDTDRVYRYRRSHVLRITATVVGTMVLFFAYRLLLIAGLVNGSPSQEEWDILPPIITLALGMVAINGLITYYDRTAEIRLTPTHIFIRHGPPFLVGSPRSVPFEMIHRIHLHVKSGHFLPPRRITSTSDGRISGILILTYRAPAQKMVAAETSIVMDSIPGGTEMLRELLERTDARIFVWERPKTRWSRFDLSGGKEIDKQEIIIGDTAQPIRSIRPEVSQF